MLEEPTKWEIFDQKMSVLVCVGGCIQNLFNTCLYLQNVNTHTKVSSRTPFLNIDCGVQDEWKMRASKEPYVYFLSMENQPVRKKGSSCFSLLRPDLWPPLNPGFYRAMWPSKAVVTNKNQLRLGNYPWSTGSSGEAHKSGITVSRFFELLSLSRSCVMCRFSKDKRSATVDQSGTR